MCTLQVLSQKTKQVTGVEKVASRAHRRPRPGTLKRHAEWRRPRPGRPVRSLVSVSYVTSRCVYNCVLCFILFFQ
ncbi:unnamed protein product [Spodoptera exigua]|nr:unnamed protein product [Spodoptera exigua]